MNSSHRLAAGAITATLAVTSVAAVGLFDGAIATATVAEVTGTAPVPAAAPAVGLLSRTSDEGPASGIVSRISAAASGATDRSPQPSPDSPGPGARFDPAEHPPPATPNPWAAPTTALPDPATAPALASGHRDPLVRVLEQRLSELGYRPGEIDDRFDDHTWSAVLAFQKAERLERTGTMDAATWARLARPQAWAPTPGATYPRVEVDLERQVVLVVLSPEHIVTLNTSTGGGYEYRDQYGRWWTAATPVGAFDVYLAWDELVRAPLGELYRPLYFLEGWAIHGSPYVPAYPDSHGCVRLSNADMDWLFGLAPEGTPVTVVETLDPVALRAVLPGLPVPPQAGSGPPPAPGA